MARKVSKKKEIKELNNDKRPGGAQPGAGRKKKYQPDQVIQALRDAHGLKTGACEILGCNFDTLQRYVEELPEAQEVVMHWRRRRVDRAEYKLDEAIERGEAWAIALTLKGHKDGRQRGYGDNPIVQNIDLALLSEDQLTRLANGEDLVTILLTTQGAGATGTSQESPVRKNPDSAG